MVPGTEKWLWLSLAVSIGTKKARKLLEHFGSVDAMYAAKKEDFELIEGIISKKDIENLSNKDMAASHKILSECMRKNIRVITPDSSEYPKRLLSIPNPPTVLYARGEKLRLDSDVVIAVVGTRRVSKYGQEAAGKLGREIAQGGGVVVTGLARGVDAIAAQNAIYAGGRTVAVLGCGVDICYPAENKKLMEATEKSGTVISEYLPGAAPSRGSFPMRNRIISGISLGTVVVEAPERSGALITAQYALDQGRDVFAVPSGIFEKSAVGSNLLIRDGAIPVLSGHDVLSEYIGLYGDKISLEKNKAEAESHVPEQVFKENKTETRKEFCFPAGCLEKFSQDDRAVLEALRGEALRADDIAARCGLPMSKLLSLLTLLEIRGHIRQLAGGRFAIKDIQ